MPLSRVCRRLLALPLLVASLVVPAVMPLVPATAPAAAGHHHEHHGPASDRCCDLCVTSCVTALNTPPAAVAARHHAVAFADPAPPPDSSPCRGAHDIRLPPLLGPPALHA